MQGLSAMQLLIMLVLSAISTLSIADQAPDMTGSWDTTALTRVTVKQVGYRSDPQDTADVTDGNYLFSPGDQFSAGSIEGFWSQKNARYRIVPYADNLEGTYRRKLEKDGLRVNDVRLVSSKLSGFQLQAPDDTGAPSDSLWGDEVYVYRLDIGSGATRQTLKVTMQVRVAGAPTPTTPPAAAALSSRAAVRPTPLDIAVTAVKRFRNEGGVTIP